MAYDVPSRPMDKLEIQTEVATRAICWVIFGSSDEDVISISDHQYEMCKEAARRVFADLDEAGLYDN